MMPVERKQLDPSAPIAGESMAGFLARYAAGQSHDNFDHMFRDMGIERSQLVRAILPSDEEIGILSAFLNVDHGFFEKGGLFRSEQHENRRILHHVEVSKHWIERSRRRFSPAGLLHSPHIRASWHLRIFPFCTDTWQFLRDDCQRCGARQAWYHTVGVDRCDACMFDLTRCNSEHLLEEGREEIACAISLVSEDRATVDKALAQLPIALQPTHALELLHRMLGFVDPRIPRKRNNWEDVHPQIYASGIATAWKALRRWPDGVLEIMDERIAASEVWHSDGNKGRSTHFLSEKSIARLSPELRPLVGALRKRRLLENCEGQKGQGALVSPEDAKHELKLGGIEISAARRKGALRTILVLSRSHALPMYDRADVELIETQLADRRRQTAVAEELALPVYAIDLLVEAGCLEYLSHPFVRHAYGSHQLSGSSFAKLKTRLMENQSSLVGTVPLKWAAMGIGGGLKPWGAIAAALFNGELPYVLDEGRPSFGAILVSGSSVKRLAEFKPSPNALPDGNLVSMRGAAEILNLSQRKYLALLRPMRDRKLGARTLHLDKVLTLSRRYIALNEISRRTGVTTQKLYYDLTKLDLKAANPCGYERQTIERDFLGS